MLSSLVYTLAYDSSYQSNAHFRIFADAVCNTMGLSPYPLKIVILTVLVVSTWLVVMYCTQPDEKEHLRRFVKETGTGGKWFDEFGPSCYQLPKRIFLCLVFALTYILPFIFIWQLKFGSMVVGLGMLFLFIGLAAYVYRSVSFLLSDKGMEA